VATTNDSRLTAEFFVRAMREMGAPAAQESTVRVLDLGCSSGDVVDAFAELGLDAQGCDFEERLGAGPGRRAIVPSPYRLPFADDSFDLVVSTGVLEHVRNTVECYREIRRVLKPGGMAMHLFVAKWFLPWEPHLHVPLANWMWPHRPRWWLTLWAVLGVRSDWQAGKSWREVVDDNDRYLRDRVCYESMRYHHAVSVRIFGACAWPMRIYIDHAPRGVARVARRMPFRSLSSLVAREFRTAFLVQTKKPNRP
jgi:SAM-dependent methyltransferase